MSPTLACIAIALLGGDIGYRPAPQGGLEFIVQIDPNTLRTLQPGDPISLEVPREAQQVRASQITLELGSQRPPRILPANNPASPVPPSFPAPLPASGTPYGGTPYRSPPPGSTTYAPATAPIVPASPVPTPPVLPATAAMPLASPDGAAPNGLNGSEPVHVAPPSGPALTPAAADPQMQGGPAAASPVNGQPGQSRIDSLAPVGGNTLGESIDKQRLGLILAVIGLLGSNGYVGWLFWDARQRYIDLVARKFAPAK